VPVQSPALVRPGQSWQQVRRLELKCFSKFHFHNLKSVVNGQ
jgi:hypothetical protein